MRYNIDLIDVNINNCYEGCCQEVRRELRINGRIVSEDLFLVVSELILILDSLELEYDFKYTTKTQSELQYEQ
jgi:hypothetical protein